MKKKFCLLGTASIILGSTPLHAQTQVAGAAAAADNASATPQTDQTGIGDIVVTARRREERLQDVPVAITALSGAQLQERGVAKLEDIRFQAPAFQIQPSPYGSAVPAFQIRGQRQQEALITQDPSVGVYVDEVYQARAYGVNQALLDLDSVQVLKGPQGTLFGRNTSGGALLVTSKRPTDRFEGYASLGLGNFDQREATVVVNLPLAAGLSFRVAGRYDGHDGYVTNVDNGEKQGTENNYAIRAGLLYEAGPINTYTTVQAAKTDGTGVPLISQGFSANASLIVDPARVTAANAAQAARGFYETTGDENPYPSRIKAFAATNITTVDLGFAKLKNVVAYRNVDAKIGVEFDGSSMKADNGLPFFNAANFANEHQFTEELQLQGKLWEDRLTYVLGGYYFREKGSDFQQTVIGAYGISQVGGGYAVNESKSLFAQADWKITDALTITGGIRYSWDARKLTGQTYFSGLVAAGVTPQIDFRGNPAPVACNDGGSLAEDCRVKVPTYKKGTPTWIGTVSYNAAQGVLAYATISRGYRSGGWNLRGKLATDGSPGSFGPFKPEIVTNYEGGLKLDFELGEIPVRLNLAGYHQAYKDIQRTIYAQFPGEAFAQAYVLNAATANIDGGEFELTVRPVHNLELSANGGYIRARYKDFSYLVAANPDGSGTELVDASDNPFSGTPKFQWAASARYEVPIEGDVGTPSAQISYYHQSMITWDDTGTSSGSFSPGYGLLDLRLGWADFLGKPVDLAFFIRNLTDRRYKAFGVNGADTTGFQAYIPGTPRTIGATLGLRF